MVRQGARNAAVELCGAGEQVGVQHCFTLGAGERLAHADMRPGLPVAGCGHAPAVNRVGIAAKNFALVDDEKAGSEGDSCRDACNWPATGLGLGLGHSS